MQDFELVLYTKANGKTPVLDFLQTLPEKMRAKAVREIKTLSEYGYMLREPYTKYLVDGIFELRIKVGADISRVLYFYYEDKKIVLTNGFIKKTEKTPIKEILKAKKYRNDFKIRGVENET